MWRGERSSGRCTNNGGCQGITIVHRGITKVHRGITKVHSGAARCRRRGVVNPIYAAFIKGLGCITPLARPHAVTGVQDNSEDRWRLDGSPHQRVRATTMRLSWSGIGADDRWG